MFPIHLLLICACVSAETFNKQVQPFNQQSESIYEALKLLKYRIGDVCPDWDVRKPVLHYTILTSVLNDVARKLALYQNKSYEEMYTESVLKVVPEAWQNPKGRAWTVLQSAEKTLISIENLLKIIKKQSRMNDNDDNINLLVSLEIETQADIVKAELIKEARILKSLAKFSREFIKHEPTFWSVANKNSAVPYLLNNDTMHDLKEMLHNAALVSVTVRSTGLRDMPEPRDEQCY